MRRATVRRPGESTNTWSVWLVCGPTPQEAKNLHKLAQRAGGGGGTRKLAAPWQKGAQRGQALGQGLSTAPAGHSVGLQHAGGRASAAGRVFLGEAGRCACTQT